MRTLTQLSAACLLLGGASGLRAQGAAASVYAEIHQQQARILADSGDPGKAGQQAGPLAERHGAP